MKLVRSLRCQNENTRLDSRVLSTGRTGSTHAYTEPRDEAHALSRCPRGRSTTRVLLHARAPQRLECMLSSPPRPASAHARKPRPPTAARDRATRMLAPGAHRVTREPTCVRAATSAPRRARRTSAPPRAHLPGSSTSPAGLVIAGLDRRARARLARLHTRKGAPLCSVASSRARRMPREHSFSRKPATPRQCEEVAKIAER